MKKAHLFWLVLFFTWIVGFAQPVERVFPFDYTKTELANGFKAYLIKAGTSGQIAYVTVVRTGSREEWEPNHTGFAHFFEHMMFRGTKKYPVYDEVLTRIGASHNAFTGSDLTTFHIVAASNSLEQIMDLESDRFMNLNYSEADFRTEAGAVLGEFNQGRANPFRSLVEQLRETAFLKHTYKHMTIGFEKDVRAMPEGYTYSLSFFRRYYRPENCVLLLVGDFEPAKTAKLIEKYYGPWDRGYTPPKITSEPKQTHSRKSTVEFPGQTLPTIAVGYKGPAWSATDRLSVACSVLGEIAFGRNSDLYRKLIIRDQTAQTFSADFELLRDPYLLTIYARASARSKLDLIRSEIEATAEKLQTDLPEGSRLDDTKNALLYGFLMGLETPRGIAFALLDFAVKTGGIEAIESYYETLQSITPEDVRMAAQTFLVKDRQTTVTLLPAKEGK